MHAQQGKQLRGRKSDIEDSRWLARICQFDLGRHSFVPPKEFRDLRALSRHRRKLVHNRTRVRNRAQKVLRPLWCSCRWNFERCIRSQWSFDHCRLDQAVVARADCGCVELACSQQSRRPCRSLAGVTE